MKRKKLLFGCLIFVGGFILLLCGINTAVYWIVPTINQNKWNASKPQDYSYTVGYGTFGGVYTHYRETVTDGVARRSDLRFNLDEPTVDELFGNIKQMILFPLSLLMFSVEYDPVYGYPMRLETVDFDLGRVTEITDFTPE